MALRREKSKCHNQTDHRNNDGVLRKHSNADGDSNSDPVAFFSRAEEARCEEDHERPGKQVESAVSHKRVRCERHGEYSNECKELCWHAPTEFTSHEANQ
jgi:hypothetical protein